MKYIYAPQYTGSNWDDEVNKIVSCVDKSWSKDQIVFYLVYNLAPLFQRDLKYFLLSDEEKSNPCNCNYDKFRDGVIVCKTLCDYYKKLLNKFDIESDVITASNKIYPPHYGLIVNGNDGQYFLDLINGLMSFQFNKFFRYYGNAPEYEKKAISSQCSNLIELSSTYINDLADSVGILNLGDSDYRILSLKRYAESHGGWNQVFNTSDKLTLINKKILYMNKYFINMGNVNGAVERKQMYKYMFSALFDTPYEKKVRAIIWRNNMDDLDDVNIKINMLGDNDVFEYVEEKKDDKFVLVRKK